MADQLTVYRLFVAAPADVREEHAVIRDVVAAWNAVNSSHLRIAFEAVSWLSHSVPELSGPPQDVINRQIVDSADILVGVFWTRLGSPTNTASSGTVEEIELFRQSNRPAALFFSDCPTSPSEIDTDQYDAVNDFRATARQWGLHSSYSSVQEFREHFSGYLGNLAHELGNAKAVPAPIREYLERCPEFDIKPDVNSSRVRTSRASFYTALQTIIGSLEPGTLVVAADSISSNRESGLLYWVTEGLQFLGLTHTAARHGIKFERIFIARQQMISDSADDLRALCHIHNLAGVKTYVAAYEQLPPECLFETVTFGDQFVDEVVYDIGGERIIENWIHWSDQKIAGSQERNTLLRGFSRKFPSRWKTMAADFESVSTATNALRNRLIPGPV